MRFKETIKPDINDINKACDITIAALEKSIKEGIEWCRKNKQKPVLLFSGGVDSGLLFFMLKKIEPAFPAIAAGFKGSKDVEYVKQVFAHVNCNLHVIEFSESELEEALVEYKAKFPEYLSQLDIELGIAIYMLAKKVENGYNCFWLGTGAEELFLGYKKHAEKYKYGGEVLRSLQLSELKELQKKDIDRTEKILSTFGISTYLPYLNNDFLNAVLRINPLLNVHPLRKFVIRKCAVLIGVPEQIAYRKKVALQYGTGISSRLKKKHFR